MLLLKFSVRQPQMTTLKHVKETLESIGHKFVYDGDKRSKTSLQVITIPDGMTFETISEYRRWIREHGIKTKRGAESKENFQAVHGWACYMRVEELLGGRRDIKGISDIHFQFSEFMNKANCREYSGEQWSIPWLTSGNNRLTERQVWHQVALDGVPDHVTTRDDRIRMELYCSSPNRMFALEGKLFFHSH
mmetsp:Transcript_15862/g.39407  ORF Transcript_15862/g.39407 Transcript_15862/m.39407 type:complete len:191 (-) Transcript_15862:207-779(-)